MTVVLFEDAQATGWMPLAATRPLFEIRVGCFNLRERLRLALPGTPVAARLRPELVALASASLDLAPLPTSGEVVLVNARLVGSVENLAICLGSSSSAALLSQEGHLAIARTTADQVAALLAASPAAGDPLPPGVELVAYGWDLVHRNPELLVADAHTLNAAEGVARYLFGGELQEASPLRALLRETSFTPLQDLPSGVHRVGAHPALVGRGVELKPGVVLDTSDGPIVLSAGVRVAPNAVIQGPAYLGPGCTVNPGAKLREGTSLGAACKVGGEVEESVVQDFSNKQHDGFLGHALVGSWVNLGADTNASDLKNNYGPVRVDLGQGDIDTGQRFVGPCIGDHAKTGINTMLSTGAVLGVAANVFGGGFPPKSIPAFTWGGAEGLVEYDLSKAIDTARIVLGRRSVRFTDAHEALLRHVHAATADERARALSS